MSAPELIGTGILMGIIHVLTGPDHLSALATLSGLNIQSHDRGRRAAFLLGVRWGVGHSFGLLIVGGLLIAMEESSGDWIGMDPTMRTILESFVGIFMLALGGYGIFKALKNRRESAVSADTSSETFKFRRGSLGGTHDDDGTHDELEIVTRMEGVLIDDSEHAHSIMDSRMNDNNSYTSRLSRLPSKADLHNMAESCSESIVSFETVSVKPNPPPQSAMQEGKPSTNPAKLMTATSLVSNHTSSDHSSILEVFDDGAHYHHLLCGLGRYCTPGILAVVAGVFHGVAGPGGVLGVIPAAQLRDARLAITYLGTFCLTSTCVMGGFAAFYGSLSEWLAGGRQGQGGNRVFAVELGSALLSLSVGFIWLILLSLGKLDEVFP